MHSATRVVPNSHQTNRAHSLTALHSSRHTQSTMQVNSRGRQIEKVRQSQVPHWVGSQRQQGQPAAAGAASSARLPAAAATQAPRHILAKLTHQRAGLQIGSPAPQPRRRRGCCQPLPRSTELPAVVAVHAAAGAGGAQPEADGMACSAQRSQQTSMHVSCPRRKACRTIRPSGSQNIAQTLAPLLASQASQQPAARPGRQA